VKARWLLVIALLCLLGAHLVAGWAWPRRPARVMAVAEAIDGGHLREAFVELQPGEFAGTLLLGGLRGLVGDLLWMRAVRAKEDGRFYEDLAFEAGLGAHKLLGWGALFLDIDEDSWPDAVLANGHIYPEVEGAGLGEDYLQPTLVYRNLGDGRFEDATGRAGPAFQTPRPARGLAAGDLDGDGRPEIVIANVNQPPSLLRNRAERTNAFLSLRLEGVESNRSAIGARVTVEADGRTQMQDVVGGGSYYSHSDLALYFGLGTVDRIDALAVRWPSGAEQRFTDVAPGRYRLREGGELEK